MRILIFDPGQVMLDFIATEKDYPFAVGEHVLFLGEIENMRGHGVFHSKKSGLIWGYHVDNFREPTEDEL